jgi:hypothetical protein
MICGESYAINSTHDAWCENNKIVPNWMFGNKAVAVTLCGPSQLIANKKNHNLYGVQIINAPQDPLKNFFVCH